jgi:hypothetical protein
MSRVSTRTPPTVNCFQSLVPTGTFQWSMSLLSSCAQAGRKAKRSFVAPSDQSGTCGANPTTPGASVREAMSA